LAPILPFGDADQPRQPRHAMHHFNRQGRSGPARRSPLYGLANAAKHGIKQLLGANRANDLRCQLAMRKVAFIILGAFLIAGSALQMAAASEHHMRTAHGNRFQNQHDVGFAGAGRGLHQSGRANNATPPALDAYGKPPPNVTQTCDIKWCYAD
jgi:hypothetical protein